MTDARPPGAVRADRVRGPLRIVLWGALAVTVASGLALLPFRDIDLLYLSRLRVHIAAGTLAFILSVPLYLQHLGRVLGWSSVLGRQIVYLALVAFPPPMAAGPAAALLAGDALLCERGLRRRERDAARRREARASFAGFALLYVSFLTGRHLLQNPFPGVVYLHWVHAPAVLACGTWLAARRVARVGSPGRRAAASAGLSISALAFLALFAWKQFLRTGEADPRLPEVHRTVESILERPRLEPTPASMLQGSELELPPHEPQDRSMGVGREPAGNAGPRTRLREEAVRHRARPGGRPRGRCGIGAATACAVAPGPVSEPG